MPSALIWGSLSNYRHPDPWRAWHVGSELRSLPPLPVDPVDPLVSSCLLKFIINKHLWLWDPPGGLFFEKSKRIALGQLLGCLRSSGKALECLYTHWTPEFGKTISKNSFSLKQQIFGGRHSRRKNIPARAQTPNTELDLGGRHFWEKQKPMRERPLRDAVLLMSKIPNFVGMMLTTNKHMQI